MPQIAISHAPRAPEAAIPHRRARWEPTVAATLVTWAIVLPICWQLPSWIDVDPFGERARALSVGPLLGATAVLLIVGWRRNRSALAGVAAGLFAGWVALTLRTALHGTPYGFGGFKG